MARKSSGRRHEHASKNKRAPKNNHTSTKPALTEAQIEAHRTKADRLRDQIEEYKTDLRKLFADRRERSSSNRKSKGMWSFLIKPKSESLRHLKTKLRALQT